ncbi:hypothetical protein ACPTGE_30915, partial [Pseudomonas aeruginosa]
VGLLDHAKDKVDDQTGVVDVGVTGNCRPDQLTLKLISPTPPEKDRRVALRRSNSDREPYVGQLPAAGAGRRVVALVGPGG